MSRASRNTQMGTPYAWRRACVPCTTSKRQCTKEVPACQRCNAKGISCKYMPARQAGNSSSSELEIHPPLTEVHHTARLEGCANFADLANPCPSTVSGHILEPPPSEATVSSGSAAMEILPSRDMWFEVPESLLVDHSIPPDLPDASTDSHIDPFIKRVQNWLVSWVTEGRSPLHHHQLYQSEMPRHVQDAYTTMAMYRIKNPGNKYITFRIIEERVTQLLDDQALENSIYPSQDIFSHLSRVQSLLTYQVIRLFDGDIGMRARADAQLSTLLQWSREMLATTEEFLSRNKCPISHGVQFEADFAKVLWRSWIIVESVRRTWIISNYIHQTYLFLKQGWSECPGRIMFTMRSGLWDAPSAFSWHKACIETDPLFVPTIGIHKLFEDTLPDEVDAFSRTVLALEVGMDKMEMWTRGELYRFSRYLGN
ncbi:hypothetical protein BKA56DRAFT_69706 [Ilyonectria sp. MPI-CAGE-AT-0026]|nr:hypothetical protein BKA56DRAFT_69706 [Ilyonectria sp. MPI-CAGE-AT-0026]